MGLRTVPELEPEQETPYVILPSYLLGSLPFISDDKTDPSIAPKSRPKSFSARFTISQISKQTRHTNCSSCLQQELSHPLRPSQEHQSGKSIPVFRQSHTKYSNVAIFATTSPITAIWAGREGLNPHHPFRTSTTGIDDAALSRLDSH